MDLIIDYTPTRTTSTTHKILLYLDYHYMTYSKKHFYYMTNIPG
jgi:hypothetical protein